MTPANFRIALHAFTGRRPFQRFLVELMTGERLRVDHPEALVLRGEVVMHVGKGVAYRLFDSQSVCQLRDLNEEG